MEDVREVKLQTRAQPIMPSSPPSSSTPLLGTNSRHASTTSKPCISDGVSRAESLGLSSEDLTMDVICPPELSSHATQRFAYALVVLSHCRHIALAERMASRNLDIWEEYNEANAHASQVKLLEEAIDRIWRSEFLQEYKTSKEIQAVLCEFFPLDEESHTNLRCE